MLDPLEDLYVRNIQGYYHSKMIVSEPEGLMSDEVEAKEKKKKTKRKKRSRVQSRASGQSFTWKQPGIDTVSEAMGENVSVDDSPSIRTNHNPGEVEDQAQVTEDEDIPTPSNSNIRSSKRRYDREDQGLFASVTRRSNTFERDGVSSDDSYQVKQEDDTGRNHLGSRDSYSYDSA